MSVAEPFVPEPDSLTGAPVVRLTRDPVIHHHLNHRAASVTPDGKFLVFLSHETGWPNFCLLDLGTGDVRRLTARRDLHPFSGVITRDGLGVLYAAQDRLLGTALPDGEESDLGRFPGARPGLLAASPDGRSVVVPMAVGERFLLVAVDLFTAATRVLLDGPVPLAGFQFSPGGDGLVCLEDPGSPVGGASHGGIRVLARDGTGERLLVPPRAGEWLAHPVWIDDVTIAFVKLHDGLYVQALDGEPRCVFKGPIWHVAASPGGDLLVCDTLAPDLGLVLLSPRTGHWRILCHPRSTNRGTQWYEPLPAPGPMEDPAARAQPGAVPATGETRYGPAWTHPRPSFTPDGGSVIFTSDASGWPQVCRVDLPPAWRAELGGAGATP